MRPSQLDSLSEGYKLWGRELGRGAQTAQMQVVCEELDIKTVEETARLGFIAIRSIGGTQLDHLQDQTKRHLLGSRHLSIHIAASLRSR